jgi:hypothetical protein
MLKKVYLFICTCITLVCFNTNVHAQKSSGKIARNDEDTLARADYLFTEGRYQLALPILLRLSKKYPTNSVINEYLGLCYIYKPDEHEKAISYLEKVQLNESQNPRIMFHMAEAYALVYKFDEATAYYKKFLAQDKNDKEATLVNQRIERCKNGKEYLKKPVNVIISNVGSGINTDDGEYVPVISADESMMTYTYRGKKSQGGLMNEKYEKDPDGEYYEDIYITYRVGNNWTDPEPIGSSINTVGHDASIALSPDGQNLFVYKNSPSDMGDIYMSTLNGSDWSTPVKLKGDINTNKYWEGSASISPDGNTLYFVTDRPGGYGGRDLYTAELQFDGSWGNIKNLGPDVNTSDDEDAPFIHQDGKILHFSSTGHNSIGGYDIYQTILEKNKTWSKPTNLGYPINTSDDDKYYVLTADGRTAYYSSGKIGGYGNQDIYKITPGLQNYKSVLFLCKGVVTYNDNPVQAQLEVRLADSKATYGKFKSNSKSGKYLTSLPSNSNYDLVFTYDSKTLIRNINTMNIDSFVEMTIDIAFYSDSMKQVLSDLQAANMAKIKQENKQPKNEPKNIAGDLKTYTYERFLKEYGDAKVDGLIFKVQIAAFRLPDNFNYNKLVGLGQVEKGNFDDGISRFTIGGSFATLKEADEFKKKVVKRGTTDAFVTAIMNNKRVYLKEVFATYGKENIK